MATEIITSSGGPAPSSDATEPTAQTRTAQVDRQGRASQRPQARQEAEPVDRIEVSTAARELAKVVTDQEPRLRLSPQQLRKIATGRGGNA